MQIVAMKDERPLDPRLSYQESRCHTAYGKRIFTHSRVVFLSRSLPTLQTPEEIAAAGGKSRIIKLAVDGYALLYHRNYSESSSMHALPETDWGDDFPLQRDCGAT